MLAHIFRILLLSFLSVLVYGQGCSDAGFCTMGAMKPDQPFSRKIEFKLRSMELSMYRGTTTTTAKVMVATADLNFSIDRKTSFQVKIPYLTASGNLGKTGGLSDLSLCFTRNIISKEKFDINLSVGGKIPTNNSDLEGDGKPFPMYYQTSLGTYDFITGVSFISRDWLIATGIQLPFINQNENQFTHDDWPDYHTPSYIEEHSEALDLKRGTDVMLRIERNLRFSRINFTIGLLPIYRITNDEITNQETGERIKPEGASGLALSGIITAGYSFSVQSGVRLLIGQRIIERDENPDGLTRHSVTTLSYYYRF